MLLSPEALGCGVNVLPGCGTSAAASDSLLGMAAGGGVGLSDAAAGLLGMAAPVAMFLASSWASNSSKVGLLLPPSRGRMTFLWAMATASLVSSASAGVTCGVRSVFGFGDGLMVAPA